MNNNGAENISVIGNKCTGCMVCVSICPQQCIKICDNREGFSYPKVDGEKCINCQKCLDRCHVYTGVTVSGIRKGFIGLYKNGENSSSGGAFYGMASYFIRKGGYVCGCVMDERFHVRHIVTNKIEALKDMQGSKYVESDIKEVFPQIKLLLAQGERVMFSGMPCQCASLVKFLGGGGRKI